MKRHLRKSGRGLALVVACALAFAMPLAGCTYSDTITQLIYDNNQNNRTDDSQTVMVNDIEAKEKTTELPKLTDDDSEEEKQETDQDFPQYGPGGTSNAPVKRPVKSITQSDLNFSTEEEKETEEQPEEADGNPNEAEGEDGKESDTGEGENTDDEGKNPDEEGESQQDEGAGKNAKNEVKVYEDYGDFPEIPEEIKHVTAVGQAAIIVSMLGGTEDDTPLLAADEELLNNEYAQKYLAKKGIANVKSLWKNDGTSKGDLTSLKKLLKLDPELCFVMEGDKTFSDEQKQALLEKNIIVYVLPNLSSASEVTTAVKIVGDILEQGGNERAGELAKEYVTYHNSLVKDIKKLNDGITGGFNYDKGKKEESNASAMNTLYISDWDYSARYHDSTGYISTPKGVGIAELGYEESPISYYMSAGGANNTAAQGNFRVLSGHTSVVWQFSLSMAKCSWKDWTSIDREKVNYPLDRGDGFEWALLWAGSESAGLGTELFPGVVVADQKMKEAMEEEAQNDGDIYYPYPLSEYSSGGVISSSHVGYHSASWVLSCIGCAGMDNTVLNDGENVEMFDIYVNPSSGMCNWAKGTVESVLEVPWTYKTFRDGEYDVAADIEEFYKTFYDYEISASEIEDILDGEEG